MSSYIDYYAVPLHGNRAQLWCDITIDDELVLSYAFGAPAGMALVKRNEHRVDLDFYEVLEREEEPTEEEEPDESGT